MTHEEWLRCNDPVKLIRGLRKIARKRKSILYLCGGCRSLWHLFYDDFSKIGVEVAERYADGLATREEIDRAHRGAECATHGSYRPCDWRSFEGYQPTVPSYIQNLVKMGVFSERQFEEEDNVQIDRVKFRHILAAAQLACAASTPNPFKTERFLPFIAQIEWPGDWLLRCVFGDPFLRRMTPDPRWLSSDFISLAETIYDERAFDRMPILGDALEEAGCSSGDVLNHCRSEEPHVRGCWVVDLVLGKS